MAFELQEKWNDNHFELSNFDNLLSELQKSVKKYKELVVTEDEIALAKKNRAYLNNIKKNIDDLRKKVVKDATTLFVEQCKELVSTIDEGVANLDSQLKAYEDTKKQAKKEEIISLWINKDSVFFELDKIWNDKWLNVTYPLATIEREMELAVETYHTNLDTLKSLCKTEYEWSQTLKVLRDTLDLSKAIAELNQVRELADAIKEEKAVAQEDVSEPRFDIVIECKVTRLQAKVLGEFLRSANIEFKQINKGE